MKPHICPSLLVCICCFCGLEYGRKDGMGVARGSTQSSHGICPHCFTVAYREEVRRALLSGYPVAA